MSPLHERILDLPGGSLFCLESGDPAGLPIVLLHGMKFQAATWKELGTIEALAALPLRILAVDMPGFGRSVASDTPPVETLLRLSERLGLGRMVVVGPSMGGRIALEFGLRHPDRLAGLVLVGAVGVEENRAGLGTIAAPTLLVWGGADQVSPLENSHILLAGLGNARREVFAGAGHPCYLEQPDRWHAILLDFLAALAR